MLLHPLAKAGHSVLYRLGHMERLSGVVRTLDERLIIQIKWLASVNHASTLFLLAASDKSKFGLLGREQRSRVWMLGKRLPICLSGPKLSKHNFQNKSMLKTYSTMKEPPINQKAPLKSQLSSM